MTEPLSSVELSPLDQIRLAEAEITRKTVAAREDLERSLTEARKQAARIKEDAREAGTRAGKVQFKEIVSRAQEEAHAITAHAQHQADSLRQKSYSRMELAIEYAVSIVLGSKMDGRSNES
jgi:vacuolar-type H+-ATPase subunit H